MGLTVNAICVCGLDETILVGCGMSGYASLWPCKCDNCHRVVQVDLSKSVIKCPKCRSKKITPYACADLTHTEDNIVARWDDLVLHDDAHKCARCGNMTLYFKDAGVHWD